MKRSLILGILGGAIILVALGAALWLQRARGPDVDELPGEKAPFLTTQKSVRISEIGEKRYALAELAGNWTLFLHFPEQTQLVEYILDSEGGIQGASDERIRGLSFSLDEDEGRLVMENAHLRIEAALLKEGDYFKGTAFIKGTSSPVPCSACKIESNAECREDE